MSSLLFVKDNCAYCKELKVAVLMFNRFYSSPEDMITEIHADSLDPRLDILRNWAKESKLVSEPSLPVLITDKGIALLSVVHKSHYLGMLYHMKEKGLI
ncbi:MAG: hypothetical protein ACTSRU_16990 [Candidatus Hodarchaeales archaeon]